MAKKIYIDKNGNEVVMTGTANSASDVNYENTTVKTALDTINQNITNLEQTVSSKANGNWTLLASVKQSTQSGIVIPSSAKEIMLTIENLAYSVLTSTIAPTNRQCNTIYANFMVSTSILVSGVAEKESNGTWKLTSPEYGVASLWYR